jgi:hypothetical protein
MVTFFYSTDIGRTRGPSAGCLPDRKAYRNLGWECGKKDRSASHGTFARRCWALYSIHSDSFGWPRPFEGVLALELPLYGSQYNTLSIGRGGVD